MFMIEVAPRWFVQVWTVKRRGELVASGWAWSVDKAKAKALAVIEKVA